MWFISRLFLGSRRHILVDDGVMSWCDEIPPKILGYPFQGSHPMALTRFLTIGNREIPALLPTNIEKSLTVSGIPLEQAGASFLLRPGELQKNIDVFIRDVENCLEPLRSYQETYVRGMSVLDQCRPALYSSSALSTLSDGKKIVIDSSGFAKRSIYNLSGGKTGRMTIQTGPPILTCSRAIKECIRSRFVGGKIVEIDFSALEPRTALAMIGSPLAEVPDIYTHVASLFSPVLSREIAKQVTISFLYGAAKSTIKHLVGEQISLDTNLNKLKDVFGFATVVSTAVQEIKSHGFFKNHSGRPIYPQSNKHGLLFNNVCQSSAVDVALSGFSNLLADMTTSNMRSVPLYFIHDAMILDVPPDELAVVGEKSLTLPTYFGLNFPTKVKILHN